MTDISQHDHRLQNFGQESGNTVSNGFRKLDCARPVRRILGGKVRGTTPVNALSYGLVARSIHSMGFVPNLIAIVGAKA